MNEYFVSAIMPDGSIWQSFFSGPTIAPKPNYGIFFLSDNHEWQCIQITDIQEKADAIAKQWTLHANRECYSVQLNAMRSN